ncbi:hypothetical protein [Sunxiuqinia sp. sy24]|uniref:hypothetical protein n=1 Tax=Sunxiuqinia sp. sy24 TaxID=3461495 RepID=UPI0040453055
MMTKPVVLLLLLMISWNSLLAQRESTNNFVPYYPGLKDYKNILIAPGALGPNALPIPAILNGKVGTDNLFRLSTDYYFRDGGGDNGHSLMLNVRFPVVQNFMAFELQWNLLEYFHTTNEVRDILQLYKDDPGWTSVKGDIILSTYIQLIKERSFWPAILLVNAVKTTSGSINDGRATDLPAHWHYFSLGKQLLNYGRFQYRLNAMAGFYTWQTNQSDLEQNEGFLWGLESQFNYGKLELGVGASGYNGWKWYGEDRPIQLKSRLVINNPQINYFIEYKTGLQDYYYSSFNLGLTWHPLSPFRLDGH